MSGPDFSARVGDAGRGLAYLLAGVPVGVLYLIALAPLGLIALVLAPLGAGSGVGGRIDALTMRFAELERKLANNLLEAHIPPLPQAVGSRGPGALRARMAPGAFRRAAGLVKAKLPLSAIGAAAGLVWVGLGVELLYLGVRGLSGTYTGHYLGPWSVGIPLGIVLCLLAVPALVVAVAAIGGLTALARRIAQALLTTAAPPGGPAREMLAESLGDRTLSIAYWLPDRNMFVDEHGSRVELPESGSGRAWTSVDRGGTRVAAIIHDTELTASADVVQAAVAGASLALENERLRADLRARLEELRASRVRIVEAADAARRRLERDLHDGAQQQLVALALDLGVLRARLGRSADASDLIEGAASKLDAALADLRELARGLHPAILTERGLGSAVEVLAERAPFPVQVHNQLKGRLPPPVEAAGYFVVAEGLTNVAKYAQATEVAVRIAMAGSELEVEVRDDGRGGADQSAGTGLRGLADRLAAVEGRLTVVSPSGGGTVLRARIPCAAEVLVREAQALGPGREA